MDLLFWKNLVPDIKVLYTQKAFFKQYLSKLEMTAYSGHCINSEGSIDAALAHRRATHREINHGGHWGAKTRFNLKHADVAWLNYLQTFKNNPTFVGKVRVEEPNVQIYSTSEHDLYQFVEALPDQFRKYINSITKPKNSHEQQMLESGKKIMKKKPTYKYKISFKDGQFAPEIKHSVLNYLDGLGDLVRTPAHFRREFTKSYASTWDTYIYSNDVNIITFLQLINPGLIRSITEMASIEEINTDIIQGGYNGQNT
jgi:hypothetical protein